MMGSLLSLLTIAVIELIIFFAGVAVGFATLRRINQEDDLD